MSYKIGLIKNTHGLKGEIVVKSTTGFERFLKEKVIYLIENGKKIIFKIKKVQETKKGLIISFYNYDDINQVEKYKGQALYTDEFPELKENEYHEKDIIGKKVYNQEKQLVGEVISIEEVPQGHLLRVKTNKKVALIPFNEYFIISVDENIIINEIEGLL